MKCFSMPCNSRRNKFEVLLKKGIENIELSCRTLEWKPKNNDLNLTGCCAIFHLVGQLTNLNRELRKILEARKCY